MAHPNKSKMAVARFPKLKMAATVAAIFNFGKKYQ